MNPSASPVKYLKYCHDDSFYGMAAITAYDPPRGINVEISDAPFLDKHTEQQVVPPHLALRLSKTPDRNQYICLENAAGERVSVLAEHFDGNDVVVSGLFDDNFFLATFDGKAEKGQSRVALI
jgi:hypothetical protein